MVLGAVFLFVMPVMGIITIAGALMVLFAVPASDPGSIRGWYIVRALAIVIIISVLAMSTWSLPVWGWTVAITLSSAFFVGFTVLWVYKRFPKIYASFVDACSRLHHRHRKSTKAKDKMIGMEMDLDQAKLSALRRLSIS